MLAGINFLALRRLKRYTHLRPTEHNVISERCATQKPHPDTERTEEPERALSRNGFSPVESGSHDAQARLLLFPSSSYRISTARRDISSPCPSPLFKTYRELAYSERYCSRT